MDSSLSNTVMRLALVLQRRLEEELRSALGITVAQFRALDKIHDQPGIGSAALGRMLLVTPQSIGGVVNGLIRSGHVQRDDSAKPGTVMGLSLMPLGVETVKTAARLVDRLRLEDEASLSRGEAEAAHRILDRWLRTLTIDI